jgi:hypothetical protein
LTPRQWNPTPGVNAHGVPFAHRHVPEVPKQEDAENTSARNINVNRRIGIPYKTVDCSQLPTFITVDASVPLRGGRNLAKRKQSVRFMYQNQAIITNIVSNTRNMRI